jgi:hypothetical protein
MPNYQNGKIYKIVDRTNDNIYVGSTVSTLLSQRLSKHKSDYNCWSSKNINKGYLTSYEIIKNNDFYIELIELYPCSCVDELRQREGYYIKLLECVNKNIAGRNKKDSDKNYRINNDIEIKIKKKTYRDNNKDKIKNHNKIYYESNKDTFHTKSKSYYEENKNELIIKSKKYYDENKEQISQKSKEKIKCVCGFECVKVNLQRHIKTKKHLKLINEKAII